VIGAHKTDLFQSLKRKYREFNLELGRTGAGLSVDEIQKDESLSNLLGMRSLLLSSPIANQTVDKLLHVFPFWKRLHGFWRTLPSFNPHTVSSEPGQDLQGEAIAVLFGNENKEQDTSRIEDEDDGMWEPEWGDRSPPDREEEGAASDREVDNSKVRNRCYVAILSDQEPCHRILHQTPGPLAPRGLSLSNSSPKSAPLPGPPSRTSYSP
jgi:hypothetical protein